MPGRKLVDEAERAVVVAGAELVEQRRLDLDTERVPLRFFDVDRQLHPATRDDQLHFGFIGEQPVLDHIAHDLTVHQRNLVAGMDARSIGG